MPEIQASEAKVHLPRLLDEVERAVTLIITRHGRAIARIVPEVNRRKPELIEHTVKELAAQRVYGLALGDEDLNDHDQLRTDPLLAVLAGKAEHLDKGAHPRFVVTSIAPERMGARAL